MFQKSLLKAFFDFKINTLHQKGSFLDKIQCHPPVFSRIL